LTGKPLRKGDVTNYIGRRDFIYALAVAWPTAVLAQGRSRRPLIAWPAFGSLAQLTPYFTPFLEGLRDLGYVEGRDFDMAFRSAEGRPDRLPQVVAETVQLNPDIIIAGATLQAVAIRKVTATIPIVVPVLADPVGLGLVASEAHPDGNVTGIAPYVKGLPAKQVELAREIVPGAKQIGLLNDLNDPKAQPQRREIEGAGELLEVKIVTADLRTPEEIGQAYQSLAAQGVNVVIVEQSNMLLLASKQIAEMAAANKLPTVYGYRQHVEAGGLISYGVKLSWCYHRAAYFVDRILKGTKPGDLPVEFPTQVEMIINLKAAKSLGLEIPPTLLVRADEVIE
jgi:putative tryptophan/tyrosine transport system substrate-binding protein